jgi:hypothetical protein
MIAWLFEKVTGTPWTTGRCASVEFGASPGAVFAGDIAGLSDVEVLARHDEFMAAHRARGAWAAFTPDGVVVSA